MGNKQFPLDEGNISEYNKHKMKLDKKGNSYCKVSKINFEYITVIGRGGFGKVWKIYDKKYKQYYAMKEMSKLKIIDKHSDISIKSERDLLSKLFHPFIVNMHYAFQDNDSLYLVLDFLSGGDLRYHLCKREKFSEEQTKFIIVCIILALEYIHSNNIMHRDLKPENLVFNNEGYVKLTDFGIAKPFKIDNDNSFETSGTPGYMAPEVLCALKHSMVVDYYALGIIAFELMCGYRPHNGNRKEVKEQIMSKQICIRKHKIPFGYTMQCADFINLLIQRKPKKRLGIKGDDEVKNHPWIKFYNWKDLYLGKIIAPFIPKEQDNYDKEYCNMNENVGIYTIERYNKIKKHYNYEMIFQDYLYFDRKKEQYEEEHKDDNNIKEGLVNVDEMIKSRNKRNSFIEKKNYTVYNNPHIIYKVLEEKEQKAFVIKPNINEIPKKNGKHSRNKTMVITSNKEKILKWKTADSYSQNEIKVNKKQTKKNKSIQNNKLNEELNEHKIKVNTLKKYTNC